MIRTQVCVKAFYRLNTIYKMENLLSNFFRTGDLSDAIKVLENCEQPRIALSLTEFIYKMFPNSIPVLKGLADNSKKCGLYRLAYDAMAKIGGEIFEKEQEFLVPKIADDYAFYPADIVKDILLGKPKPYPMITFTITSCKRYDLFEKTINSFLNCCIDYTLIDKWLCVDDNSSEEDRKKMKEKYPFFTFYFKTPEEKGHPKSMNIIREKVSTPYIFHMEDDWKFFRKHPYLTECLSCIATGGTGSTGGVKQCLINRNYAETEKDWGLFGGFPLEGGKYVLHEYCKDSEEYELFYAKYGKIDVKNCAYWPHFSFRPSLIKTEVLKKLGEFDEKVSHFELEYSRRYFGEGYKSAFLNGIYCLHTGRLTTERSDTSKQNAYDLNGEKQLYGKESQQEPKVEPGSESRKKTYVINLDRRPDRMRKISEKAPMVFTRFSAVDGKNLVPTEELQRIFDGNDYNMRAGMVGCALSHLLLWKELAESDCDSYCILEDDIDFVPQFSQKLDHLYKNLPKDWDMCYLGHHLWDKYKTENIYDKEAFPEVEKWDTVASLTFSKGGTGGYIISKRGAKNLLDFIENTGMTNGIDTMQQKSADFLDVYYCRPHLIYSECYTPNNPTDTDIQKDANSLTIPLETRLDTIRKTYPDLIESKEDAFVLSYIQTPNTKPLLYVGEYVHQYMKISKYPCYPIEYKALFVSPSSPPFRRLDHLAEAIMYKVNTRKLISLGETTHLTNLLNQMDPTRQPYPFDLLDGETLETVSYIIEMVLTRDGEDEIASFVKDFCGKENNSVEVLPYNGKQIVRNTRYRFSFPHEEADILVPIYTDKFQRLLQDLKGTSPILLFHACHFTQDYSESIYRILDQILPLNGNVKLLTVNGLPRDSVIPEKYRPYIRTDYVMFPEVFRHQDWNMDKVRYDQETFRHLLVEPVRAFLAV